MSKKEPVTKNFSGDSYGNLDLDQVVELERKLTGKLNTEDNEQGKSHDPLEAASSLLGNTQASNLIANTSIEKDEIKSSRKKNTGVWSDYKEKVSEIIMETADQSLLEDSKNASFDDRCDQDKNNLIEDKIDDRERDEKEAVQVNEESINDSEQITSTIDVHVPEGNVLDDGNNNKMDADNNHNETEQRPININVTNYRKSPCECLSIHITKEHDNIMDNEMDSKNSEDADDIRSITEGTHTERTSARSRTRPNTTSTMGEVPGGLRAKANTPASLYTDHFAMDSPQGQAVRESSRGLSSESRDEVFQRAMTLMSNRCTSARGEDDVLFSDREPPFGVNIPQYFYVQQKKPSPMPPLKVWRGYKGNVYFEPMTIQQVNSRPDSSTYHPDNRRSSEQQRRSDPSTRAPTRATTAGQSTRSYNYNSSSQVYILDKRSVINRLNENMPQELRCIEGIESTGSLAVRPLSSGSKAHPPSRNKDGQMLFKRERICRGPNFNHQNSDKHFHEEANKGRANSRSSSSSCRFSHRKQISSSAGSNLKSRSWFRADPNLMVSGDKFTPPTVMSPLLRTTTQFSITNQRATMNSPDFFGSYDKLPPLDQVQVSLGQMTGHNDDIPGITSFSPKSKTSCTEELKPFIKYSPKVKASYEKNNLNYC